MRGKLPALCLGLVASVTPAAENVDPDDDGSQYAYAENLGWINAEPSGNGGPGVEVGDFELTGWLWGENAGWISLSCKNNSSCGTVEYGVVNDGSGILTGYAWGENVGWLNFACTNNGTCGAVNYGVSIDPATGEFFGRAWSENQGWITFSAALPVTYKVKSGWSCDPPPAVPAASPDLTAAAQFGTTLFSWTAPGGATGFDFVRGDLGTLRATGSFVPATDQCLTDNETDTTLLFGMNPAVGEGYWFLVRGVNCGGPGSFDTNGVGQSASRDAGIAGSGNDCP